MHGVAAVYTTILTNKIQTILPQKIEAVGIEAGLNSSSIESLLMLFSTNITAVPGYTETLALKVQAEAAQGYAESFR
jgi:hypothetical protein